MRCKTLHNGKLVGNGKLIHDDLPALQPGRSGPAGLSHGLTSRTYTSQSSKKIHPWKFWKVSNLIW